MVQGFVQIALFFALIVAVVPLLGGYMARVFRGERTFLDPVVGPLERFTYRLLRVDPTQGRDWKVYARGVVFFSLGGWLLLYLILRTQTLHPFNPEGFHSGTWDLSFNTTSSFVTNTNWQYYGGETTLSYFSQMAGLAVQNFVSAATGMIVAIALIRGIIARRGRQAVLGNFWQDLVRACFYVLLPISIVAGLILVSQGTLQTLGGTVAPLARGPVASQEVIKELGTNGGGFFNTNSAFPFENPNSFTNLLEMFLILCIPASLTYTFGRMVGSRRQGWAVFSAMAALFITSVVVVYIAELHGTPAQHAAGVHTGIIDGSTGGNMEGKETRFGIADSTLWAAITTVTSCGAVNAALESFTANGGRVPGSYKHLTLPTILLV
jgi:K+-transporting ATPase ATPase A chain